MKTCLIIIALLLPSGAITVDKESIIPRIEQAIRKLGSHESWMPRYLKDHRYVKKLAVAIVEAAQKFDYSPYLVTAIIRNESNFNHRLLGKDGEYGLMQIIPKYALRFGCADRKKLIDDIVYNIECGLKELRYWEWLCEHRLNRSIKIEEALSAYNTGQCRNKHGLSYARRIFKYFWQAHQF